MKNVFYKRLLVEKLDLCINERIIYSFLIYNAICNCEDVWDKETGAFDDTYLTENEYLELPRYSCSQLANNINIGKATVSRAFHKLELIGIIDKKNGFIYHNGIYKEGYFNLKGKDLNGQLLVFYSWLNYLKGGKSYIFASRQKISELYHIELSDIRWYLHRLKELGFVERKDDGKLLIK